MIFDKPHFKYALRHPNANKFTMAQVDQYIGLFMYWRGIHKEAKILVSAHVAYAYRPCLSLVSGASKTQPIGSQMVQS